MGSSLWTPGSLLVSSSSSSSSSSAHVISISSIQRPSDKQPRFAISPTSLFLFTQARDDRVRQEERFHQNTADLLELFTGAWVIGAALSLQSPSQHGGGLIKLASLEIPGYLPGTSTDQLPLLHQFLISIRTSGGAPKSPSCKFSVVCMNLLPPHRRNISVWSLTAK